MKLFYVPLLLASLAFAQHRPTPSECAAISRFNNLERAENRGMKPGELEQDCQKPAPRKAKAAPNRQPTKPKEK